MQRGTLLFCMSLLYVFCFGCGVGGTHKRPALQQPVNQAQSYNREELSQNNPGSIFAMSDQDTLFDDARARRVGDIVVVKLVENTKAQNKAETTSNKDSSNNYGVNAFFTMGQVGFLPFINLGPQGTVNAADGTILKTQSQGDLSATGKTKRENYVLTSLAARVLRVLPGGLLEIEGAREIRVNNETEYMVVRGMARAKDVDADNTILSTQLANATIEYYGKGVLADKQKPGWFTRLMDNIWPF
ncbi:MAG: flagellar basal body L-ring protein FlgH [Desulfovibrionaceae bacterium]|nr:flagellar basal body L-ring protein FlgH [Desulfovibrionaceae bacterium]